MSDLEVMRAMLKRAKIEAEDVDWPEDIRIKVEGGYPDFYTILVFSLDGSLVGIEAYE